MTWMIHDHRCASCSPPSVQPSTTPESAQPTNDHFSKLAPGAGGVAQRGDAERLGGEAGDRDHEEGRRGSRGARAWS